MEFRRVRALRGPNIWAKCTALEVAVAIGEMKFPVREIPGFEARLREWVPAAYRPFTPPGGKPEVPLGSLTLAHVLERVVVTLHTLADCPVGFSRTAPTTDEGDFSVVVEYREEDVSKNAFEIARILIEAAIHDRPFDVPAAVSKLRSQ